MIEGETQRLCLTLGALAELETAFGCETLGELQTRLRALSATEMMVVLAALLRGGGTSYTVEALSKQTIQPADAARAIAEAFRAALG